MHDLIEDEIREALQDWATLPVRVVALGHSGHLVPGENENEPAREVPHVFRQKLVYAYVFEILRVAIEHSPAPLTWSQFRLYCDLALSGEVGGAGAFADGSTEEREAAESFAWKVLRCGWNHALTGFPEHRYITLRKGFGEPAPAK